MTDADLIYNALLRAEARLEKALPRPDGQAVHRAVLEAVQTIREEIGNGLAAERR
jgi:hypothetical protein